MASLTPPDEGIVRLGRPAVATAEDLGPLADLVGTWMGAKGWELIAVPAEPDFKLILRPYIEVLSVQPIGAVVPDRGGPVPDLCITGVMYDIRITDAETHEPLHLENGMWLYLPGQDQEIARMAAIPHGDALLALGSSTTAPGAPTFPTASALPDGKPANAPLGYTDPYLNPGVPFNTDSVNDVLAEANQGLDIVSTTTLSISTQGTGGILNIPFVSKNANATAFTCDYWIETMQDAAGNQVMQLQYSQQTNIEFLEKADGSGLIMWPHVNVNTLRKQ
jgi:hypothetical protein